MAPSWAHLGPISGPCWAMLGHVGPSWGHLGSILGRLGLVLGHLSHLGRIVGLSWAILGLRSVILQKSKRFAQVLLVLQPLPSILSYVIAIPGILPSFGPVLAILAWGTSVMCPYSSKPFLRSWAMWSLSSGSLTRPGGMREAIEQILTWTSIGPARVPG